jgi:hypothetical protein
MKTAQVKAKDFDSFSKQINTVVPEVKTIFRDAVGFVANMEDGTEQRLTPIMKDLAAYNNFFHGISLSFEGTVNVPEAGDTPESTKAASSGAATKTQSPAPTKSKYVPKVWP